jgi:hypothetical protein
VPAYLAGRRRHLASEILSGPVYNPSTPLHQKTIEARARIYEQPGEAPMLMLNRQGLAVIGAHFDQALDDESEYPVYGWTIPVEGVRFGRRALLREIARTKELAVRKKLQFILDTINDVTRDAEGRAGSKPLIAINPDLDMSQEELDAMIEEERGHLQQLQINGTFYDHLDAERFLADPVAQKAARELGGKSYSQEDKDLLAAEIGVRLLRPRLLHELRLTDEEAQYLAAIYTEALTEHNGESAHGIVRQIRSRFPAARGRWPDRREVSPARRPNGRSGGSMAPGPAEARLGSPAGGTSGERTASPVREFLADESGELRLPKDAADYVQPILYDPAWVRFRAGKHGRQGTLYGNIAATAVLEMLEREVAPGANGPFLGVNLSRKWAQSLRGAAQRLIHQRAWPTQQRDEVRQVMLGLDAALRDTRAGQSISYVELDGPLSKIKRIYREEHFHAQQQELPEIGRASCRERVCQYV